MFKDGIVSFEEHMLLAGTPATVVCAGTSHKTTLPAPIFAPMPISMLPKSFAPAPIKTPERTFGCLSPHSVLVPPKVTSCKMETSSSTTLVSPATKLVAWSSSMPPPNFAAGWMSTP